MRNYFIKSFFFLILVTSNLQAAESDGGALLLESARATVTLNDFRDEISRIPMRDRGEFLTDVKRVNAVIEQLYITRALAREAESLQLDKNPDIARKMRAAQEKILAQERLSVLEQSIKLPDFSKRARELYLSDKKKYTVEPTVKAAHVLIGTKTRTDEEALKKAREVQAMLVSGGKTMEQVAPELSDDPSAKTNHGELGWFGPNRMVKAFSEAAFAMKPGAISAPVKTDFGYHVILLQEKKEGRQIPFEEVKQRIIDGLAQDYIQNAKSEFLAAVKHDKSIVVHEAEIKKLNPLNNVVTKEVPNANIK